MKVFPISRLFFKNGKIIILLVFFVYKRLKAYSDRFLAKNIISFEKYKRVTLLIISPISRFFSETVINLFFLHFLITQAPKHPEMDIKPKFLFCSGSRMNSLLNISPIFPDFDIFKAISSPIQKKKHINVWHHFFSFFILFPSK